MSRLPPRVNDRPRHPRLAPHVKAAADACRVVGGLFVLLGGLPLAGVLGSAARGLSWPARAFAIVTTIVLVAPGVWYVVASRLIRRGDARAARTSLWVAAAQAVVILLGLFGNLSARNEHLAVPSLLALFFVPALGATCFHLVRARRAAAAAADTPAFEALAPKPVLPLEPQPEETPAPSLRPKDGGDTRP
jgi:hypothetical protein